MRFHKGAAYAIMALCLAVNASPIVAQQNPQTHRIRAVIGDLRSPRQAHEVDLALRAFPGVRMSRTDYNTRNLLLEVTADCAITRDAVQALLQPYALTLTCWSRGAEATYEHALLDPRRCAGPPTER